MAEFVGATDSAAPCAMMVDLAVALDDALDARERRLHTQEQAMPTIARRPRCSSYSSTAKRLIAPGRTPTRSTVRAPRFALDVYFLGRHPVRRSGVRSIGWRHEGLAVRMGRSSTSTRSSTWCCSTCSGQPTRRYLRISTAQSGCIKPWPMPKRACATRRTVARRPFGRTLVLLAPQAMGRDRRRSSSVPARWRTDSAYYSLAVSVGVAQDLGRCWCARLCDDACVVHDPPPRCSRVPRPRHTPAG